MSQYAAFLDQHRRSGGGALPAFRIDLVKSEAESDLRAE
jgi:hypothetical protein